MAIMVLLQLPPMMSSRILVSLLYLSNTRQVYVTGYTHPYVTIRIKHLSNRAAGIRIDSQDFLQQHNRNTD